MNEETKKKKDVNRRDFMKRTAAGVGVAAASGSGLLSAGITRARIKSDDSPEVTVPQISPSQIKETVSADVVVVGAGISGACAALSAIEAGAKTVLLEKGGNYTARGNDNGCVSSSVHREAGVILNREELIAELMIQANYRVDQRLLTVWADHSGEAVDWLRSKVEPEGLKAFLDLTEGAGDDDKSGPYKAWRTAVSFTGSNARMMSVVMNIVKRNGGDIRYNTPAVQLIRQGNGRVTGVIGRNAAGDHIQFDARRGVILSTGGYDNSPEMMKRYLRPSDLRIERYSSASRICTGDGHNMGLAIGADMDEPPHCLMVCNGTLKNKSVSLLIVDTVSLRVDKHGRRYVNEDGDYCRQANANAILPGHFNWSIFDSSVDSAAKQLAGSARDGIVLVANSIEELARKMEVDPDVFKATVARYNELAKNKKDVDFGVDGKKMRFLGKPPYYAAQVRNFALVSVSGLRINEKMQVLDTEGNPIPGLYASGNASGGFFGDTYPRNVAGISCGRAITFGRIAGKTAAAEEV
jgi:fumarate reductase flavoprotein subunit